MTIKELIASKDEHTAWLSLCTALKAEQYITDNDLRTNVRDRSTPERAWMADAWSWLHGDDDPHSLRNRFRQLFPGEVVLDCLERWIELAETIRIRREQRKS